MFASIEHTIAQLREQQYLCDRKLATVAFLALQMRNRS